MAWYRAVVSETHGELEDLLNRGHSLPAAVPTLAALLSLLHRASAARRDSGLETLPDTAWCSTAVLARTDLKEAYAAWRRGGFRMGTLGESTHPFSVLQYPFLLDANAKARVLRIDAVVQMAFEVRAAVAARARVTQTERLARGTVEGAGVPTHVEAATVPYLVLEIRRDHLVEDAMCQVAVALRDGTLKKPLKIRYMRECVCVCECERASE